MKSIKRIEPYIYIVTAFLVDMFILVYGNLRHLSLPARNKKGPLSTLFQLFTDLAERLIGLKQELTRTPWSYGKKYIRLGMLALTWALFMLSSFEWTVAAPKTRSTQETIQTTCPKATSPCAISFQSSPAPAFQPIFNISLTSTTLAAALPERWLLLRRLLI